jgi:hypothetical protein
VVKSLTRDNTSLLTLAFYRNISIGVSLAASIPLYFIFFPRSFTAPQGTSILTMDPWSIGTQLYEDPLVGLPAITDKVAEQDVDGLEQTCNGSGADERGKLIEVLCEGFGKVSGHHCLQSFCLSGGWPTLRISEGRHER